MNKRDLITIKEGSAEIYINKTDINAIPSKSMSVFYNKKMEINRDISNLAILAYNALYRQEELTIVDSMAASGVSSIRMLKECNNIKKIFINDINPDAVDLIYKNIELNKLNQIKTIVEISKKDANFLFTEIAQNSFDLKNKDNFAPNVISIDPFGTPNIYIDSAFKTIQKNHGLLCITATDTAVLFGVRPKACIRKYMSKPLHNEYCKEIGARILVYFISRIANVNKLGIIPLLTFYSTHFIRVFALTIKDKKTITDYFKYYGYIIHCNNCNYRGMSDNNILNLPHKCPSCSSIERLDYAGPLWINDINDKTFIETILNLNEEKKFPNKKRIQKLIKFIKDEIGMPIYYYNVHKLCQQLKLNNVPNIEDLINSIIEKKFKATRTQFDFTSIKTNMDLQLIKNLLLENYKKN
jgi:tRNA (guanine26-N2/guanine27-N2)-dimethyltransferase